MGTDALQAARSHAHEDLAGDAAIRATQAREAATRCTGVDREYCIARAEALEREADRLRRDAGRGGERAHVR